MHATEEALEAFIKRHPEKYKVFRNSKGRLYEVYDIINQKLWVKKLIYVGNNKLKRTACWMCLSNK